MKEGIRCLRFAAGGSPFFIPVAEVGLIGEAAPTKGKPAEGTEENPTEHIDLCALLGHPGTARYRMPLQAETAVPVDVASVYGVETVLNANQWPLPLQVRNPENAFVGGIGRSEEGSTAFLLDTAALLYQSEEEPLRHISFPTRENACGPFLCLLVGEERCLIPERDLLAVLTEAEILPVPRSLPGVLGILWHKGRPVPAFSPESRACRMLVLAEEEGVTVALGADRLLERISEDVRPENSFCMDIPRLGQPEEDTKEPVYDVAAYR